MNIDQDGTSGSAAQLARAATAGDWDGGIDLGRRVLGIDAGDPALYLGIGALLRDAQMIDGAEAWLARGCAIWPQDLWLRFHHAYLATHHRDLDVALARWNDLTSQHPDSPLGLCGVAELYRHHGREDEAGPLFAEAAGRYPDYVWAAHGDANTPTWRGDWPEAARRWAAVRERFPDHSHAHVELAHALLRDDRIPEADEALKRALATFEPTERMTALAREIDDRKREFTVEFFIASVFRQMLHREPTSDEAEYWLQRIRTGLPEREFFRQIVDSDDAKLWHQVVPGHPAGHFYSPVIDPKEVVEDWRRSAASQVSDLSGISLDTAAMREFWTKNVDFMKSMDFAENAGGRTRYYWNEGIYPVRDALTLAGMIHHCRPQRIIEIGSGFSTAAILDTFDRLGPPEIALTCIDPDASTLRDFLRPGDAARVTIIESRVQDVPAATIAELEPGDILLIDSTHVMKTGSDVHYEFFTLLPAIKPGVMIHFHDVDFPFEYHELWVFENGWSWNEAYALRAFLAYNNAFRIVFFTDLFCKQHPELTEAAFPGTFPDWMWTAPGGSIWITRDR